ncbi:MAG: proteasome-type protease [Kiloniellales bacterium]|nr:proteasome-type protease [Kiloniellales bacterium]MDJ0980692.1 proteasome-type protease [Kiloniellales bacterium]
MTYCVGLYLQDGLVLLSDTRTNAGVDHISTFSKMHVFETPGERVIVAMTAGNLAISQAVINLLSEGLDGDEGAAETLLTVPSMFRAARLVGRAVRQVFETDGPTLEAQGLSFDVSVLLAGQIKDRNMRLFQVYAAGNFIEATEETPFLQIGEHKYGKPILDRVLTHDSDIDDGIKLVLISMDSTLRSNLTVGMPLDLLVYRRDSQQIELKRRISEDDPYFQGIRQRWSAALREAYQSIPRPDWDS